MALSRRSSKGRLDDMGLMGTATTDMNASSVNTSATAAAAMPPQQENVRLPSTDSSEAVGLRVDDEEYSTSPPISTINVHSNSHSNSNSSSSSPPQQPVSPSRNRVVLLETKLLPDDFHRSPEPLPRRSNSNSSNVTPGRSYATPSRLTTGGGSSQSLVSQLHQIQENAESPTIPPPSPTNTTINTSINTTTTTNIYVRPYYSATQFLYSISTRVFAPEDSKFVLATWLGFWSLLFVTMAVSTITPIRDAVALQVGVQHMPKLTLASSVLAFLSSVPIGWLFEAPDPSRRKVWKKMGLTRGETQGTSLALFYRFFAITIISYAIGFSTVDLLKTHKDLLVSWFFWLLGGSYENDDESSSASASSSNMDNNNDAHASALDRLTAALWELLPFLLTKIGQSMYIAFFLVVHLMKLHSISLVWGVTAEAMEYEDVARKTTNPITTTSTSSKATVGKTRTRLQRLALVGFGGTMGGIIGSILASTLVAYLHLPGLLVVSAVLLEVSAELSIELGRIMQKHWEEQQVFRSSQDLAGLDSSMRRTTSMGSMKRVASGNSLMKRVASGNSMNRSLSSNKSLSEMDHNSSQNSNSPLNGTNQYSNNAGSGSETSNETLSVGNESSMDDNTFSQRLLRGITTILKSRLLMAIFTYNALFASTTVLLSFKRAELVVNRNPNAASVTADTAFLGNINLASSMAVFAMQASGMGALLAHRLGPQGSLALMPAIRLLGVISLCWWHRTSGGQAPNLIMFLMLDECTRVVNLAVAKPVRESLWRGLSNEARYEAKPIVDTLANRWGAGSASFCVSMLERVLVWLATSTTMASLATTPGESTTATTAAATTTVVGQGGEEIVGLPPILFLCLLVAAWWAMVSLDLGHIRRRIDMELKKRQ